MKRRNLTVVDNVYHADFGDEAIGDVPFPPGSKPLPFFPPTLRDWSATFRSFAVGIGIIALIGAVYFGLGMAVAVLL